MKAIIIGAGRIGRGFITELLAKNQTSIVFFDYSKELIAEMNRQKKYTVHVLGAPEKNVVISNFAAYPIDDEDQLALEWESADFIFTAVGGKNLGAVAQRLAKAFQQAHAHGDLKPRNIITCENWIDPADELKEAILDHLTPKEQKAFIESVGVSESVILCSGVAAPPGEETENSIDTWVQDYWNLPVDKSRIVGEVPTLDYIDFIDDFGDLLQQKIYTNNTSVALIAYLGYLKGHTYVPDAANDPEIETILDAAYHEINQALIQGLNIKAQSQIEFSKRAKEKYQDRNLVDLIVRIARDPLRKLRPIDRLIGPAQLALKAGTKPRAIALATAAALFFDNAEDPDAVKLEAMREEKGIDYILETLCGLTADDELHKLIHEGIAVLKEKQWIS